MMSIGQIGFVRSIHDDDGVDLEAGDCEAQLPALPGPVEGHALGDERHAPRPLRAGHLHLERPDGRDEVREVVAVGHGEV